MKAFVWGWLVNCQIRAFTSAFDEHQTTPLFLSLYQFQGEKRHVCVGAGEGWEIELRFDSKRNRAFRGCK